MTFKNNLILIGFRGTGKSTLSTECSQHLGWQRISTDENVVKRLGISIADFVAANGWAEFRRVEHEEIRALQGISNAVIDCGGGVVENPENMSFLGELGTLVWIDADIEDVLSRLLQNESDPNRPLLSAHSQSLREDIITNYTRRRPMYEQYAKYRINTSINDISTCVANLCSLVR